MLNKNSQEKLREELNALAADNLDELYKGDVLRLSQQLDAVILTSQKRIMGKANK